MGSGDGIGFSVGVKAAEEVGRDDGKQRRQAIRGFMLIIGGQIRSQ